jgi:GH25 family lysozyme M1 (1,4-beta-N-acetylmuramidase)
VPVLPRTPRRLAAVLVAAAAGFTTIQAAPASAAPQQLPTAEARAAGVVAGDAPMGWKQHVGRQAGLQRADAGPQRAAAPDAATAAARAFVPSGVLGIDVSSWQRTVNWSAQAAAGKRFAYVKATEGATYKNPYFRSQYDGSYKAGLIRGAYHFARPANGSGKKQAAYFVKNGGGWSADGHTLPGVLDIEYNPYGATCYGLSKTRMTAWIKEFVTEYKRLTRRDAVIYTTTDWWTRCTGNTKAFSRTNPLWLARYSTAPGKLPGSWTWATFWQYSATPIDQNRFSSTYNRLVVLAKSAG